MSRTCTTCIHPDKEAIDKALLSGQPYRSVAKHYEASPPSVYRHQQDHLPVALAAATEAAAVAHGDSLLEQLTGLRAKAFSILARAEAAEDLRTALMGVKEVRSTLELIAKVTGELVTRHDVNVNHNLTTDLTLEQLEDIALVGRQVREAHGIVDVEAYLVQDLRG